MTKFEITGTAQHAAWQANVLPEVEQVRPGLWSIPVPIPNNPLRYVLVYAFESDAGITIVDAGWNTDEAWDALCGGIAAMGGSIGDVRGVMVTHIHPDHYGLAGRVREASGAWIGLHPADDDRVVDSRMAEHHGSQTFIRRQSFAVDPLPFCILEATKDITSAILAANSVPTASFRIRSSIRGSFSSCFVTMLLPLSFVANAASRGCGNQSLRRRPLLLL